MTHQLFLNPGVWRVAGYYLDRDTHRGNIAGTFTVNQVDAVLTTQSHIVLNDQVNKPYVNSRVVEPFLPNKHATLWRSSHSLMGPLQGSFTIVEDSILSNFNSPNHYYVGSEYLIQVFSDEYSSRGAVLAAGQRLISWRIELTREC
ncbi:MAG: hypothetical protein AAF708_19305 [Deinococcota bacterium]